MTTSVPDGRAQDPDQPQDQPQDESQDERKKPADRDRDLTALFFTLVVLPVVGTAAALLVATVGADGDAVDAARWAIYMLATALVAALAGLIFGVPRVRAGFTPEGTERYEANSNLEQISDWLTKLLVGAGLVELTNVPGGLRSLGEFLGNDMSVENASAFSVSAVVYGVGLGFAAGYLWTRLRFRILLEKADREALLASRTAQLAGYLGFTPPEAESESSTARRQVAASALTIAGSTQGAQRWPILWVDDHPENNTGIIRALADLAIRVDTARSSREGLALLDQHAYSLIISDLARIEDGQHHNLAGKELVQQVRESGITTPVIIFGGPGAMRHEQELLAAGATLVSQRTTQVFEEAVRRATGSGS